MRRFLLIFLLVLLPVQFGWAAVTAYCQHESGAEAQHFGHHTHQHRADHDDGPDLAKFGGSDPDCGACHASCASPFPAAQTFVLVETREVMATDHPHRTAMPPVDRPDRPNWSVLA